MDKGKHISFCGIGGAGKTTHAKALHSFFQNHDYENAIHYHGFNPGINIDSLRNVVTGALHESFSDELISMAYLLDLKDTNMVLKKDVEEGKIVITERFWLCSKIFSSILSVDQFFIDAYLTTEKQPDIVVLLDVDPKIAYQRLIGKSKKMANNDELKNLYVARDAYLKKCKEFKNTIVVDTSVPLSLEAKNEMYFKILGMVESKE